jgi:hypothetical protein
LVVQLPGTCSKRSSFIENTIGQTGGAEFRNHQRA